MRCTDILRSLIVVRILKNDKKKILFFGTTMHQNRNYHNLFEDLEQESEMYLNYKNIFNLLNKLKLDKGSKKYLKNLMIIYKFLIKKGFIAAEELKYLNAWIKDCNFLLKI